MIKGGPNDGNMASNNLHIWRLSTGKLVSSYQQKTFKAESIQWMQDEELCCRLVTNEVHIQSCNPEAEGAHFPTLSKVRSASLPLEE